MAFYEYRCENGHLEEMMRNVSERRDPVECPECGEPMELKIGSPRPIFPLYMKERLNRNWEHRKKMKATGEW